MKISKRLDDMIYNLLFDATGAVATDATFGYWWADSYAIWRGEIGLTGEADYDQLIDRRYDRKFILWRAGGGPGIPLVYGFGYWCGEDEDLLCFRPCANEDAEDCLSPMCKSVVVAFVLPLVKRVVGWRNRLRLV